MREGLQNLGTGPGGDEHSVSGGSCRLYGGCWALSHSLDLLVGPWEGRTLEGKSVRHRSDLWCCLLVLACVAGSCLSET